MKKSLFFATALFLTAGVAAQNPTVYFMENSTLRSQLNPALAPQRGYVNVPMVGSINVSMCNNLPLDRIFYPRDGKLVTLLDGSVSAAEALSGLKTDNLVGADSRVNIIGFGAYTKNRKNFWSFDLNMRVNAEMNVPYSLFEFVKEGREVEIRDIGVSWDTYLEAGFNYSFPIGEKLYLGVRGKFLAGLASMRMNYDRFDVSLQENRWAVDAAGTLDVVAGGVQAETRINDAGEEVFETGDIDVDPTKPVGYGFAVDLGATYNILPELQVSLAVNDLGFISWSKNNALSGVSSKTLEFTGARIENGETQSQPDFDLDALEFRKSDEAGGARSLRASINAGAEYSMWNHRVGFGLLYSMRFWQYKTIHSLTGSVNLRALRWFSVTGSYTVTGTGGGAFGVALNIHPSWINLFLGTDVITAKRTPQYIPVSQRTMNVTFGLGVPIGKRGQRTVASNR